MFIELNPTFEDENIEAYVERLIIYGRFVSSLVSRNQAFYDLVWNRSEMQDIAASFGYTRDQAGFGEFLVNLLENPETLIFPNDDPSDDSYYIMDFLRVIDGIMVDFIQKYNRDLDDNPKPHGGRKCKKCKGYIAT
jgi:hypothetical protein